jgi:hypothetical protein
MINDLEQAILAALRRAHDEFALNGFEAMAITMTRAEREVRDLAAIARKSKRPNAPSPQGE